MTFRFLAGTLWSFVLLFTDSEDKDWGDNFANEQRSKPVFEKLIWVSFPNQGCMGNGSNGQ